MNETLKSVHICQNCRKNKSGTFLWPTVHFIAEAIKQTLRRAGECTKIRILRPKNIFKGKLVV